MPTQPIINSKLRAQFEEAKDLIKKSERILIAGHTNPDGDSLGSLLALSWAIRENLGKETLPYMTDESVPSSLNFLPGSEELTGDMPWFPDLIIGVDYGDFERLALPEEAIENAKMITFDHHPVSRQRGDIKVIDINFSSTAELAYSFLTSIDWRISSKTALCLLAGIFTDTGAFAHNTSANTFKTAGELLQQGAELGKIYSETFAGKSADVLNVWGRLLESSVINEKYGYNAIYTSFDEFKEYGIVLDDLTGLISIMNRAKEAKFSVLAVEHEEGKTKGSIRSDKFKDVDVSQIAKQLGGGGHKYASGFEIEGDIEEARKKTEKAIANTLAG